MIRFAAAQEPSTGSISAQFAEMALIYDTRALEPEVRAEVQARQDILIKAEAAYHRLVWEQEKAKREDEKLYARERVAELRAMKQAQYMRRKSLERNAYYKHGTSIKYGNHHRTGIEAQLNHFKELVDDE